MQAKLQLVPIGQLAKFAGKKVSGAVSCTESPWQACSRLLQYLLTQVQDVLHCVRQSSFQKHQPAGAHGWNNLTQAHRPPATWCERGGRGRLVLPSQQ